LVAAVPYVLRLLGRLPKVEVIVLLGRKASMAKDDISMHALLTKLMEMPHPGPLFVNRKPTNREQLLGLLREVARLLT
jgi:hypothetical protein